jgi:hypothetical protein
MPGVIGRLAADDEQAEREALWEARALDRAKSRKPRAGEFGLWLPDGPYKRQDMTGPSPSA